MTSSGIPWGSCSISHDFFAHVGRCYEMGVQEQAGQARARAGLNGSCDVGVAAYPVAVAAWDALLSEVFLSPTSGAGRGSDLASIPVEEVHSWPVLDRTFRLPKLALGTTFAKGHQPYQDLRDLVAVRNSLVHFSFDSEPRAASEIRRLSKRGIFLAVPRSRASDYAWPAKVSCTEGIRWTINTLAAAAREIERMADGSSLNHVSLCANFQPLSLEEARAIFLKYDVDPEKHIPER